MVKRDNFDIYCEALDFMEEHLSERLHLNDIARHCAISTSGLVKVFKAYGESGVMRCFLNMKLELAAAWLKADYTVSYIATKLNFSSIAHFSGVFKKKYGISPLKYKRLSLEKQEKRLGVV